MLHERLSGRFASLVRRVKFRAKHRGLTTTFEAIHRDNYWAEEASKSGPGSGPEQTRVLVEELPQLLRSIGARSVLDIPCGDFAWMRRVDLSDLEYVGCDIVPSLIERNSREFGSASIRFAILDLTSDDLPRTDVILVRDCLGHLSNRLIWRAIRRIKASGSSWLLATTFPDHPENPKGVTGRWRPLCLTAAPFDFPDPVHLLVEGCTEQGGAWSDKSLALWRVEDLPGAPRRAPWRVRSRS